MKTFEVTLKAGNIPTVLHVEAVVMTVQGGDLLFYDDEFSNLVYTIAKGCWYSARVINNSVYFTASGVK